jgi:hypothetical protein
MTEHDIEKFAGAFAQYAATGDNQKFIKSAVDLSSLLFPLIGAGVGGAAGYLGSDKQKDKERNALYGALIGGLGGTGVQLAKPVLRNLFNGAPPAVTPPSPAAPGTAAPTDITGGTSGLSSSPILPGIITNGNAAIGAALGNPTTIGGGVGSVVGAGAGLRAGHNLDPGRAVAGRLSGGRHKGELNAAANGLLNTKAVGQGNATKVDNTVATLIKNLLAKHGPGGAGVDVADSLNKIPGAPTKPVYHKPPGASKPEAQARFDAETQQYTKNMLAYQQAQQGLNARIAIAKKMLQTGSLGNDAATRSRTFAVLQEMANNIARQNQIKTKLKPSVYTDLANKYQGTPTYRAIRGGTNLGKNVATTLIGSRLAGWLGHYLENLMYNPEAPAAK